MKKVIKPWWQEIKMTPAEKSAWDAMTPEAREALCRRLSIEQQQSLPRATAEEIQQATEAQYSPEEMDRMSVWAEGARAGLRFAEASLRPLYQAIEKFIHGHPGTSAKEIHKGIGETGPDDNTRRILADLKAHGRVFRHGRKQGYYPPKV